MSGGRRQLPDTLTGQDVADYRAKRVGLLALGRRHGVSAYTVRGWLKCRRVPIRPIGQRDLQPDMVRVRQAVALLVAGHKQIEAGRLMGISGERVRQLRLIAEQRGIPVPKPRRGRPAKAPVLNGRQA